MQLLKTTGAILLMLVLLPFAMVLGWLRDMWPVMALPFVALLWAWYKLTGREQPAWLKRF
jgi:hypothetical protein